MEGVNYNYQNPNTQRYYYTTRTYNPRYIEPAPRKNDDLQEVKAVATAGILQGAAILLQKLSQWCGNKLMQGKEFTNSENVKKIASKMLFDNGLSNKISVEYIDKKNVQSIAGKYKNYGFDLTDALGPVARGENAFYTDQVKLAVAPKNKPSLILHELGHAVNAHKGKFLKFLQNSRSKITALSPLLILLNNFSQKPDNEKTFIEKNAGTIGFLAFLPTIVEEGIASLRGIKAAKQIKNTVDKTMDLKPLKRNYAFAWMTYLIAGIIFGIGTKLSILENKNSK